MFSCLSYFTLRPGQIGTDILELANILTRCFQVFMKALKQFSCFRLFSATFDIGFVGRVLIYQTRFLGTFTTFQFQRDLLTRNELLCTVKPSLTFPLKTAL